MSNERRVLVFMLATFTSIMAINFAMDKAGLLPKPAPPKPKPPAGVAKLEPGAKPGETGSADPNATAKASGDPAPNKGAAGPLDPTDAPRGEIKAATVPLAKPSELILGSTDQAAGYHLEVQLDQRGAGVVSVASSRFDAEYESSKPSKAPLEILRRDNFAPLSLSMILVKSGKSSTIAPEADESESPSDPLLAGDDEIPLNTVVWELVRDEQGRGVRPIAKGQEAIFQTNVEELGLTVTKTYRLNKGEEAFEVILGFESPEKTGTVTYRLLGPHGIPIEGEWYTGTFRDAVFGQVDKSSTKVATLSALEIVKAKDQPERFSNLPLRYAGVENQYFTSILLPWPAPKDDSKRWDSEARPTLIHENAAEKQKSDIGVEVWSKPLTIGPNLPVSHTYKVYAGAKTTDALKPFEAEDLATYHKNSWFGIPFATFFSGTIITPLLAATYGLTRWVSALFGGTKGNYGIAIMLLTATVRLGMFPLSRKQAISAKKMQDLQPYMKEVQEKYKDDKEAHTRETFALYKKHGVNPVGGCLPALIQLPIFVGLWQALNNSVSLRHAPFLYIENLAAPDMLFQFPGGAELPFVGRYFNLLPFGVVALMLVQTKLFAPPPTTPEAEMQQKMMKYMMVFMAFMFYKVPAGLGIYFITSSLWSICERLLLPKTVSSKIVIKGDEGKGPANGDGGGGPGGGGGKGGGPVAPGKPPGRFAQFWEKVVEEASKDSTYRKLTEEKSRGREGDSRDRDAREREKTKPRSKPGRRR